MQRFVSNITWDCPVCQGSNNQLVAVPELDFSAERSGDMSTYDSIELICDNCDAEFEGYVWSNASDTYFEIEQPQAFSFHGDMPMYWPPEDDYDPPDDPESIAIEALTQLASMVGTPGPRNDLQFVNRLIFSGAIATLEAYLGDTLVGAVQSNPEVRARLLSENPVLGKLSISAAELAGDPDILTKRLVSELRGYLYHNLVTVTELYKDAFEIRIAPSKEHRDALFKAMPLRHDCVHRNGANEQGEKLESFTDEYVTSIVATIRECVVHIESEVLGGMPF